MKSGVTKLVGGLLFTAAALSAASSARSEDYGDPAALAKAMSAAKIPLEQGLRSSGREGRPISGKYELENGALQLSVYTVKGGKFTEVIVDHATGAVRKAEPITEKDDLQDATAQNTAMAKAKVSLDKAVGQAVRANSGYRAISVIPSDQGGHPVAEVTLMKGAELKKVTAKLD